MLKKYIYGLFFLIIITGLFFWFVPSKKEIRNDNPNIITSFHINQITFGGDFTLVNQDNKPFTFSSVFGKPSMLYFGFTHCPDFCPASLQIMDAVANEVDINRIFISVDPKRDTPKTLSEYISLYRKGLSGLTGTPKEVENVTKKWNIYYSLNQTDSSDMNYTVDHTTYLYLTDKQGKPMAMIRPEATPKEILEFINNNKSYF